MTTFDELNALVNSPKGWWEFEVLDDGNTLGTANTKRGRTGAVRVVAKGLDATMDALAAKLQEKAVTR